MLSHAKVLDLMDQWDTATFYFAQSGDATSATEIAAVLAELHDVLRDLGLSVGELKVLALDALVAGTPFEVEERADEQQE
jgi:hypothetical protein